jgi:ubiquinone/menaquinone biosynthesis C-methylase UbiE
MVDPDDAKRWDVIHKKTHKEIIGPSAYAQEKEKQFPRGSVVCELGGGTGADAVHFLKNGHSVILLDISDFALKVVQKQAQEAKVAERLKVVQTDFGLHALPLSDNSVDIAYSRISLNYFGRKQTTFLFTDIYRILKPGGRAFITLKSPDDAKEMEYLERTATVYEPNVYIDSGQLRSRFTKEHLQEMLQQAGVTDFGIVPYQEDLGPSEKGDGLILYVNEVVFTKK